MVYRHNIGSRVFNITNHLFLLFFAFLCIFPIIHVLSLSLSSPNAVNSGFVTLWPVDFTLESYKFLLGKAEFFTAFMVSIKRVLLGVTINTVLTVLSAYPLSMKEKDFPFRTLIAWIFMITMLFSGGLMPTYLLINSLNLMDKIWVLVLPAAVPVFNVVILLNFFRGVPGDYRDAAFIDGAGHFRILKDVYVPLAIPAIVTVTLITVVNHWNSWFDGLIYMSTSSNYPLQSYLQTIIIQVDLESLARIDANKLREHISDRTQKAAQIFVAMIPIIMVYPFAQKYFISGMNLGGIKG